MQSLPIVQLPDLCLRQIFSCLDLRSLVRCRAVCRLFKLHADQVNVPELVVSDMCKYLPKLFHQKWYTTDRSVDFECSIKEETYFCSQSLHLAHLLQQLKFLYIYPENSALDYLDRCKQLVHLEILFNNYEPKDEKDGRTKLVLPSVRVLCLCNLKFAIALNAPRLEVLECFDIENVKFDHPETIKKLESDYRDPVKMSEFTNLEVFRNGFITDPRQLVQDILSNWKKLRVLDLRVSHCKLEEDRYDALRIALTSILKRKASMRIEEPEVYLNDVLILQVSQLEDYEFMKRPFCFLHKNYHLMRAGAFPHVYLVNYTDLIGWHSEISNDFFDKFSSISSITANGVVDRNHFEWFIKKVTELRYLYLTDTSLDQSFLDRLPNINDQLTGLEINEKSNTSLNFDFILNFKALQRFETNQAFERPMDLAAKMIEQSEELHISFQFRNSANEEVRIKRDSICLNGLSLFLSDVKARKSRVYRSRLSLPKLVKLYEGKKRREIGRS